MQTSPFTNASLSFWESREKTTKHNGSNPSAAGRRKTTNGSPEGMSLATSRSFVRSIFLLALWLLDRREVDVELFSDHQLLNRDRVIDLHLDTA